MFAVYGLLTRYVARKDSATVSFFWTGVVGAVAMTPFGLAHWVWMTPVDWGWMALLCCTAALSHWLLIKSYAVAEASAIQPFAYLQLVWATRHRAFRLWRDLADQCRHRRGHRRGGGDLHSLAAAGA